jgi:hypothetical protein
LTVCSVSMRSLLAKKLIHSGLCFFNAADFDII